MKILVDENMPYAAELFSRLGDVQAVPGRPIPREALADADALMVRSVTKVNEALLAGSRIGFVGTATAGTDHVDDAWLQRQGIGFRRAGLQRYRGGRVCVLCLDAAGRTRWLPSAG